MCGIFGIVGAAPFSVRELEGMSRLQRHRGPDDEGVVLVGRAGAASFAGPDTPVSVRESGVRHAPRQPLGEGPEPGAGGVALGHRRLSILDLSPHGHQPMVFRDRYWITYNGEVYNYLELRQELTALGYLFESESDTEVILAAYDRWGPECLSRFNGMWALALLDMERKTLFLARDRFGVKPLYYRLAGDRLAFASEIKAFAALADWRPRANAARLLDYLVWTVSDHTAETMFEGVMQLPAGHWAQVDVAAALQGTDGPLTVVPRRWYALPQPGAAPPQDGAEALRGALQDAVRLRLRSDVPVGSCLSGGLDSSSIVCLMSGLLAQSGSQGRLRTITATSSDRAFDESSYARAVAVAAGSDAVYVTPEPKRLFEDLPRLAWHQDEPFMTSSIFAQWCVFDAARKAGVTVMLDGQGADETLCGYRGFFGAYLAGLVRTGHLGTWWRQVNAIRRETGFSATRAIGYTAAYLWPVLVGTLGRFDNRAYADRSWLKPAYRDSFTTDPHRRHGGRVADVRGMSVGQITSTNLPMLLHWEDRNSMAFSIEARVPFLDYRVVELALALPDTEKVGNGIAKAVLRKAMRSIVPDAVLDRRDKMGFVTAESTWMKGSASALFRADLASAIESLPNLLSPTILKGFDEFVAGRRPFDHRYWRILCLGRWATTFSTSS